MNLYQIRSFHNSIDRTKVHIFKLKGTSIKDVMCEFYSKYPNMSIIDVTIIEENIHKPNGPSPTKQRSYFKTRLCQIRNNIQSMTDSESPYLTDGEIIQLQRINSKIDNIISKFGMRTMDLKREGIL